MLLLCKSRVCSEVCSALSSPHSLCKALPPFLRHRAHNDNLHAKNNHSPAGTTHTRLQTRWNRGLIDNLCVVQVRVGLCQCCS